MAVLPQLSDPKVYRPCSWDLTMDRAGRAHWVNALRKQLPSLKELIQNEYQPEEDELNECLEGYTNQLDKFEHNPEQFQRADILSLTAVRRDALLKYGFDDPYRRIKQDETRQSLEMLAAVLEGIDSDQPDKRLGRVISGLMAGNIFDLGAQATRKQYQSGEAGFEDARAQVPPRPWFIDDVATWRDRWESQPYRHVLMFVDNAGSDIVLGCIPFARWMLQNGARVTLAANSRPALNDITADELTELFPQLAEADPVIASAIQDFRLRIVASGSSLPVLDLTNLADNCVNMAMDADLIVLLGMARAIESNYGAHFRVDALWSAVLKDQAMARHMGGDLFDCVFRFPRAQA